MQREKLNEQNNLRRRAKEGYIIIPNYFLREYIKVLGVGPAMFYQYLLTYCHKNKNTAWPSLSTSSKDTGITKKTLTKYYRILIQYGLIKKFSKKKLSSDGYMRNIYQLTPLDGEKITLHKRNFYHHIGVKITPDLGKKLPPNNTNLNITNSTTTKGGKDAAVAVVNFKKLKEKGDLSACTAQAEEKMRAPHAIKEYCKEQAIREQLEDLDFKESFIEQLLKDYPLRKIEEKIDLLLIKRNIQNPPAWLISALKNDYHDSKHKEEASYESSHSSVIANDRRECGNLNSNILSTEEARERFHSLREKLMAMN